MFDKGQITTSLRSAVIRANSVCYRSSTMQDDTVNTVLNTLTHFAADLVIQQLTLSRTINYAIIVANSEYIVSYKEKQHSATPTVCECSFHKQMKLPCRHILFIWQQLGLAVFDASLVHGRFCQDLASTQQSQNFSSMLSTFFVPSANNKTAEGRYRKATALFSDMASYLSVLSKQEFLEKVTFLEDLFSTWHEPTATATTDTSQPTTTTSTDTTQPTVTTLTDTAQPTATTSTNTSQLTMTTSTDTTQPIATTSTDTAQPTATTSMDTAQPTATTSMDTTQPTATTSTDTSQPTATTSTDTAQLTATTSIDTSQLTTTTSTNNAQPTATTSTDTTFGFDSVNLMWQKKRSRPNNVQHFTRKRRARIPKQFSSLSIAQKQQLIIKATTSVALQKENANVITPDMLRNFADFEDTVLLLDLQVHLDIVKDKDIYDDEAWVVLCDTMQHVMVWLHVGMTTYFYVVLAVSLMTSNRK